MPAVTGEPDPRLAEEQAYTDMLFQKLDDEFNSANAKLAAVMKLVDTSHPDPEALLERETDYHHLEEKLSRLNLAQMGLVFGRIDVDEPDGSEAENPVPGHPGRDRRYIGRLGIHDRNDDYRSLLLDWRAPMSRPFYLATTAHPEGVHVRRHIRTTTRTVTRVTDEILSGNPADAIDSGGNDGTHQSAADESALLDALNKARTGHMTDIVQTIQREQDEIIRDTTRGILVATGGPGTGKTAVALHRVAYLLYTYRDVLSKTGVLIVGPSTVFLDYISRVLPELGETGVVLSTLGELYPGVKPKKATEDLLVREIKGSSEMAVIIKNAVTLKQTTPAPGNPITLTVEGVTLTVDEKTVAAARTRARRSRRPHNQARGVFRDDLFHRLATQMANLIGADPLGGSNLLSNADIDQLHDDLMDDEKLSDLVDSFWPPIEPVEFLAQLLSSRDLIAKAAKDYDEETQFALYRQEGDAWTASDAALLDELAVLVGAADPEAKREEEERQWRKQIKEAQEALDILISSADTDLDDEKDAEILSAHDVIDAETLARRQSFRDHRTTAERARDDWTWAYGHVIVDEAQELTPMEWRMVMRRCPSKWMTLVGDTAQTESPNGVDNWDVALGPFCTHYTHHELTVNYRTPAAIANLAATIQKVIAPDQTPATVIRDTGDTAVSFLPAGTDPVTMKAQLLDQDPSRTTAIIVADQVDTDETYSVSEAKGLEFDHVIVVDPERIAQESPQGLCNLYVAITRATQTLTIIGDMPTLD